MAVVSSKNVTAKLIAAGVINGPIEQIQSVLIRLSPGRPATIEVSYVADWNKAATDSLTGAQVTEKPAKRDQGVIY